MKFSESWLRSFVNPQITSEDLSHLLTMAGLEVEERDPVAPDFNHVVVAQVIEVSKHPDADRLNVCRVDFGDADLLTIVCGAPNVAAGMRVPCALPGAVLPGGFTIKVAKVRGVESFGMLCSAKELGIAEDASGLMVLPPDAPLGQSIRGYLDLDDHLFTIKLTPNRADCLSLLGVAREVSALTGASLRTLSYEPVSPSCDARRSVVLDDPQGCSRYCGRVIRGLNARAATPEWMRRRLERCGIRSISALVDITNYVMLELGQPLHVFDNTKLEGAVHVRLAKSGDQLQLLNEQSLIPDADVLMIADEAKPLAMAGIMGGEDSGVTLETSELFLEAAFFSPRAIAGRARRYGFGSDASHRFERGVDFAATANAIERATRLILDLCGGEAGPVVEALADDLPKRTPVRLRPARVSRVLGMRFSQEEIAASFDCLGFSSQRDGDDFVVTPPSYRFDIEIEEDLIEELARLRGYENIPAPAPRGAMRMRISSETQRPVTRLRQLLVDRGYQEVINFAFVDVAWERDYCNNDTPIRLANPIASQMAVMRSSLIGGLVDNLRTNLKRKQTRVRLFETGRCFQRDAAGKPVAGFKQALRLAGLAWGGALPESWASGNRKIDFYDLKADLEALLAPVALRFEKCAHPALHPGRSAALFLGEEQIGVLGELHPEWVQKEDFSHPPVLFEVELAALSSLQLPAFAELSRFPAVVRDLAIVVDHQLELQRLIDGVLANKPPLFADLQLFDVYVGKGVPEGKKSLALRIVMQDTQRTLLDSEVDVAMQQLTAYLGNAFAAQLRA